MSLGAIDAPPLSSPVARKRFFALLGERAGCLAAAVTLRAIGADTARAETLERITEIDTELARIHDAHKRGLDRLAERHGYGAATPDGLLSSGPAAVVRR